MADSLDKQIDVADVYARALFDLARDGGAIDATRSELDELVKLAEIDSGFDRFMVSGALDDDHREAGLEKMFRGKLSDIVLNTLLVMNQHGRHALLRALHRAFVIRQADAAGQVEARVTSAVELDSDQKRAVTETAARISGRTPLIDFRVNPAIIGGLIMQMGDWRYDNSIASQLAEARKRLMERSERGLAVGTQ